MNAIVPHADRKLVFISAAEPSADAHAAALIRAARQLDPTLRFVGIAGPKMVEAGCTAVYDLTRHAAMLLHALGNVTRGVAALSAADACFRRFGFAAAVVVDSPMLHLHLAAKAQAAGMPVLYYIAPQLWAWGAYRIRKVRHRVDRLACILPFEEAYFRNQGVDARFVGHPLVEQVRPAPDDPRIVNELRSHGSPLVAILPGSRNHVVESVLPGQLDVARRILEEMRGVTFVVSVAHAGLNATVDRIVAQNAVPVRLHHGSPSAVIQAADLVLVASGTAALEVALHERSMIVMYNASPLFYHLVGRWMLQSPYLSLPNILAGRAVVPEFMPYYRSTKPIAHVALEVLRSESQRHRMAADLREATAPLRAHHASNETAKMLVEMIQARTGH